MLDNLTSQYEEEYGLYCYHGDKCKYINCKFLHPQKVQPIPEEAKQPFRKADTKGTHSQSRFSNNQTGDRQKLHNTGPEFSTNFINEWEKPLPKYNSQKAIPNKFTHNRIQPNQPQPNKDWHAIACNSSNPRNHTTVN